MTTLVPIGIRNCLSATSRLVPSATVAIPAVGSAANPALAHRPVFLAMRVLRAVCAATKREFSIAVDGDK